MSDNNSFDDQTDSYVPVFYVLLTSKTQQIYTHALHWIEATINQKNPQAPSHVTSKLRSKMQFRQLFLVLLSMDACSIGSKQSGARSLNWTSRKMFAKGWYGRISSKGSLSSIQAKLSGKVFRLCSQLWTTDCTLKICSKWKKFGPILDKFWIRRPSFIITWNIFGHYKNETVILHWTNNRFKRYNRTLNLKFQGKQSLLSFITVLETEAREEVIELDEIRNGNIMNNEQKRDDSVNESELALKIPSFL